MSHIEFSSAESRLLVFVRLAHNAHSAVGRMLPHRIKVMRTHTEPQRQSSGAYRSLCGQCGWAAELRAM